MPQRIIYGAIGLATLAIIIGLLRPVRPTAGDSNEAKSRQTTLAPPLAKPITDDKSSVVLDLPGGRGQSVKTVRLLNKPVAVIKAEYSAGSLEFSHDNRFLQVNDELWHVESRKRLTQIEGNRLFGAAIAFATDGMHLSCVDWTADFNSVELKVFRAVNDRVDLVNKQKIKTKVDWQTRWHTSIWSPGARYVAIVAGEQLIITTDPLGHSGEKRIVDPSLLEAEVDNFGRLKGPGWHVAGLAFSPDENTFAVAFEHRGVFVFGLPECQLVKRLTFEDIDEFHGLRWSWPRSLPRARGFWPTIVYTNDGKLLLTKQTHRLKQTYKGRITSDSLMVWDTSNFGLVKAVEDSEPTGKVIVDGFVGTLPRRAEGLIYSYQRTPALSLWNVRSGNINEIIKPPLIPQRMAFVKWSSDGRRVMLDQVWGAIQIWDIESQIPLLQIEDEMPQGRQGSTLSSDGRLIATGYSNGQVGIWDIKATGTEVALDDLKSTAKRIRREDDLIAEAAKNKPPFRSSSVSIDRFIEQMRSSGEASRKGLPVRFPSQYHLKIALGEPTNVYSLPHEIGRATREILDYACKDGRVRLSVAYDLAGAWINEVMPIRAR